ncbi:Ig-like domain-containing protein, partial [Phytobacter sp. V91]|uniref:Ig-like domain-containing protein n=1 Tax=Phytobacter sp. V91 TaxID=3369425 RepID=UPI003F61AFD7
MGDIVFPQVINDVVKITITSNGVTAFQNFNISDVKAPVPVISGLDDHSFGVIEGGSPLVLDIDGTATVTDGDSADFDGGNVTVSFGSSGAIGDVLSIRNQGTAAGQIGLSGGNVTWGGTLIGTVSGGSNGTALVVTLNANATPAAVQDLVRGLTYQNISDDPSSTTRTLSVTVNDGDGHTSAPANIPIMIIPVNDAPLLSTTTSTPTYTENGSAVSLFSGTAITTVESGQTIRGLTFNVGNLANGSSEIIRVDGTDITLTNGNSGSTLGSGISYSVSLSGTTATVALNSVSGLSSAVAAALVNGITYRNSSDNPTGSSRTITLSSLRDSGGTASGGVDTTALSVSSTVTIAAVNDAPVNTVPLSQSVNQGDSLSFNAGAGNAISISDADAGSSPVQVTLTASHGALSLSTITGLTFITGTGANDATLTIEGTLVNINNALNGLTFTPTAGYAGDASIQITTSDLGSSGAGGAKTDTDTINIDVVSTASVVTGVTTDSLDGVYKAGDSLDLHVSFDSDVNVDTTNGTPQLLLETGSVDRYAQYVSGSGSSTLVFRYIVQSGDTSADLDYASTTALSLNGGTIRDGNGADAQLTLAATGAAGSLGAANNIVVDGVAPTVSSIVMASSTLSIGQTSQVTITFTEAVTGLTAADLTISNGTLSGLSSSNGGLSWTGTFTPTANITSTGNYIVLNNNISGVRDLAGNAGKGIATSNAYAIDTQRPTAAIVVADTQLARGATTEVTITFSEAVTNFTTADLFAPNGTLSNLMSSDGGITWTVTLTANNNVDSASNTVLLNNSGVNDLAGNAGTGLSFSNSYAVDTLRPTATIVMADTVLTAGESTLVTITFSEPVTGFSNEDLIVGNGTLSAVTSQDGGVTWTATFTPN